MKIIYDENSTWELDYIKNNILNIDKLSIDNLEVELYNEKTLNLLINREEIVSDNIFVVSSNFYNLYSIINIVKKIKPVIIIHLSDEYGQHKEWNILEKYTMLLLRQYNHKDYDYGENNIQIPLGYISNFIPPDTDIKHMSKREINCSFIGSKKTDRMHMCNIFEKNMKKTNIEFVVNSWNINNLPISQYDMFTKYNNSIFVIVGRGNSSLDCYRIYEAIAAGAIPVVVGPIEEINVTFNYGGNKPKLIYSDTWENAVLMCNNLLQNDINFVELQNMQDNLLEWLNNHPYNIKANTKYKI